MDYGVNERYSLERWARITFGITPNICLEVPTGYYYKETDGRKVCLECNRPVEK